VPHPLRDLRISDVRFLGMREIREVGDGFLLANDMRARTVSVLDRSLKLVAVVMDSAAGKDDSYGPAPAHLFPFAADSSMLYEPAAGVIVVLDAKGHVVRTIRWSIGC
jgi:hypothetical protein